jgi:hypothetical protein
VALPKNIRPDLAERLVPVFIVKTLADEAMVTGNIARGERTVDGSEEKSATAG